MCEPAHSIVQIPENFDDSNLPFGGQIDPSLRLKAIFRRMRNWGTKIGKWYHFSKLGSGHSRATNFGRRELMYLPPTTDYEGFWWLKEFRLDGMPWKYDLDAFNAAKQHHEILCMANAQTFRRFMEQSLKETSQTSYFDKLIDHVLNKKGRRLLDSKLKRIGGKHYNLISNFLENKDRYIRGTMGILRRRELFIPEWSDDRNFWTGDIKTSA